ncbi:hypothetical protein DENIT_60054 [Pseudomonas veronii]|nr:hypothetical protein DENIT_60054 [Pseudomonas veronii]
MLRFIYRYATRCDDIPTHLMGRANNLGSYLELIFQLR